MDTSPTPDPLASAAPSGDGADLPASGQTVDMSQVAGKRAVPVTPGAKADGGKKKKGKAAHDMTEIGPTEGARSPADQALAELGTKRGIETMFRSAYRVNMDLSALADAKANIMISINGLIVSILIASIAPGMEKNPWLYVPTTLFLLGCLVSLVFAVLAARPRVQSEVVTKESALRNRTNVLFFGNFSHMPQIDFVDTMKEVVQDPTQIYEMMMKDIYGVGSVLQKKYKMLRTSYGAFLVALIVGVLGFILVFGYVSFFDPTGVFSPAGTTVVGPATGGQPVTPVPGILPQ